MSKRKNSITGRLLSMNVGDEISFPIIQFPSVRSTISTIKLRFVEQKLNFESETDKENAIINVVRIA